VGGDGEYPMLYMSMFRWEPGKTNEIIQKRMKESIPSGIHLHKEWVALETNIVFRLFETDDPGALLRDCQTWVDLGTIEMHPVMDSMDAIKMLA
jgi:hypothetical protein